MKPSQLLKAYEINKQHLLNDITKNDKSISSETSHEYVKNDIFSNKNNKSNNTFKAIETISSLMINSIPLFLMNKLGVPNISNNFSTTSSSIAIGTVILQTIGNELKHMNLSNYQEKLKLFFNKEVLSKFSISEKPKSSIQAQFDNQTYYQINVSDSLLKMVEKEKIQIKMFSIFDSVKNTLFNIKSATNNSQHQNKI